MLFRRSRVEPPPASLLDRRGYYRGPMSRIGSHKGQAPANKGMKLPAEVLTEREVLAILATCGRGPCGRRDAAIVVTMWRAGTRVGETVALMPKDVNLERGELRVLHGKGDVDRAIGIDPMACAVIGQWIEMRSNLGLNGRHPLYCVVSEPTRGLALKTSNVRQMVKRRARAAGIEKRVHPHGFRHTCACDLDDEGFPLTFVQSQLGHSSPVTTARYLAHLNARALRERMRAREWPADELRPE